jgi:NitT/TauT family transport system permease protein
MAIADIDEQLAGLDALEIEEDRESPARKLWAQAWPKFGAIGLAIFLWQVVVWTGWRPSYALPGPGTVFPRFFRELSEQVTWRAIGITMRRASVGFAMAILIGGLIGIAVSRFKVVRTAVGSLITGLQTMPSIAWFPLSLLLFQKSEGAIYFVIVLGAAPSIANGLITGIDHIPPILLRAGRITCR